MVAMPLLLYMTMKVNSNLTLIQASALRQLCYSYLEQSFHSPHPFLSGHDI